MNLRIQLLAAVFLLFAVVGGVQIGAILVNDEQLDQQQRAYADRLRTVLTVLAETYPDRTNQRDQRWVRQLLANGGFPREVFRDVMVSSGGVAGAEGFVDLNPVGAAHRSSDFSVEAVRAGIRRAKDQRATVRAAGGWCVPVGVGDRVDLGVWYVPAVELPEPLSMKMFFLPLLAVTILVAFLAYLGLGRLVLRPLERLNAAAKRVGAGDYGMRVEPGPGAPELNAVIDAFNSMSAKVAGHAEELQSEVQRATEEAARRERAMVVSSRLAAMGTLAAGIAHEINNPIGGMINAVRRLQRNDDLDEKSRQYLDLILEGLERVTAIARRVLDFSPREIDAAPFRLDAAVASARDLVDHRFVQQGVTLETDIPADLPDLVGDRHEIQQVLLNCLLNSLDVLVGRQGGVVRVEARLDGSEVEMRVADNGPGADAKTLARVLDPFFSAKGDPASSGLGLFICYSIVSNHGGTLEVASQPGEGFTVVIRLPVPSGDLGPGSAS